MERPVTFETCHPGRHPRSERLCSPHVSAPGRGGFFAFASSLDRVLRWIGTGLHSRQRCRQRQRLPHHFSQPVFEAAVRRGYEAGRTRKHVATPVRGSAAKRLNMYLRWMVRPSRRGVDFGVWSQIKPSQLMVPLDVHTGNVGRKLGLLTRKQNDWHAVEMLTAALREVDPVDPVRLDFALFGLGAIEQF